MKRNARAFLGTSILGFAVVFGCNCAQRRCHTCTTEVIKPTINLYPPVTSSATDSASAPATELTAVRPPQAVILHEVHKREVEQVAYSIQSTRLPEERPSAPPTPVLQPGATYGHGLGYSWLLGELQYVHIRNVWRLRYASVDEDDRYGGCVTLADTGALAELRSGQIVRVEGHFADPDSHEPSPEYRVRSLERVR